MKMPCYCLILSNPAITGLHSGHGKMTSRSKTPECLQDIQRRQQNATDNQSASRNLQELDCFVQKNDSFQTAEKRYAVINDPGTGRTDILDRTVP